MPARAVRHGLPAWAIALAVLAACAAPAPERPARPALPEIPVVLISVDTLRADRVNAYGYAARRVTPHMDALARDGVLFESHITSSPWTTPAHLSLFTSLSPSAHGVMRPFKEQQKSLAEGVVEGLAESRTTMAELLAARGYRTAAFTGGSSMDPRLGFGQGFALYDTSMFKLDDANMARLFAWTREHREGGFFLFWHTFEVHAPYLGADFVSEVATPGEAAQVRESTERIRRDLAAGGTAAHQAVELGRIGALRRDVCEALYVGSIKSMDERLGAFLGLLRELSLYERALIVLTSDHGEEFADRSADSFFNVHGHNLHEEMVRVPLVLKLPGQRHAGTRVKAVTRAVDVLPTVLRALSLPLGEEMQGLPLQPLFEGSGRVTAGREAFVEALSSETREAKAVRTDRHKYVFWVGPADLAAHGRAHLPEGAIDRQLFDLRSDPEERVNLLSGPRAVPEALVRGLDRRLRELAAAARGAPENSPVDPEVVERLRALGYVDP
jgi:arylsulfatase A-like enzyme